MKAVAEPGTVRVLMLAAGAPDDPEWVRRLVKLYGGRRTPRCTHLRGRSPRRTVFMDDGRARCQPCAQEHAGYAEPESPFGVAVDARERCVACGGERGVSQMTPVAVMAGALRVLGSICGPCEANHQRDGGAACRTS